MRRCRVCARSKVSLLGLMNIELKGWGSREGESGLTKWNTNVAAIHVVGDGGLVVYEGLLTLKSGPVTVVGVAALGGGEGNDCRSCAARES